MLLALVSAAHAATALLIVTPGFDEVGFLPLQRAIEREGVGVVRVVLPPPASVAEAVEGISAAQRAHPDATVVAHGLGATLAVLAAERGAAPRYVLLAPVLGVVPSPLMASLAASPPSPAVSLRVGGEGSPAQVLLGPDAPPLSAWGGGFAAELQSWVLAGHVPVHLGAVTAPVWLAVGLTDEVATVEAVVPASRALPRRRLVRVGMTRFDPQDYSHGQMLTASVPTRLAARAAARDRWIRRLDREER